jgi:hypothetical protein
MAKKAAKKAAKKVAKKSVKKAAKKAVKKAAAPKISPLSSRPLRLAFDNYERKLRKLLPDNPQLQPIIDALLQAKALTPQCLPVNSDTEVPPLVPQN